MTDKKILANNLLIAKFMGDKNIDQTGGYWCEDGDIYYWAGIAIYHRSWDWIMPVVEKIGLIDGTKIGITYTTGPTDSFPYVSVSTWNYTTNRSHVISLMDPPGGMDNDGAIPLITAIYLVVVEFIKFYNKHGIQNKGKKQARQPHSAA